MELFHLRRGSGEPLLLIQGMSGTHLSWGEPFLGELERDFDVVYYDHRGIGNSPALDGPFTIGDLADDAAALLDRVGWDDAHVLGISMGGMVAQELALRHGGRIRTLALGCTYCGGPQGRLTDQQTAMVLGEAMMSGDRERAIRAGYDINVSAAYAAAEGNYAAFREMALAVPAALPTILAQLQAIQGHDTSARLPSLDVPTLVVHGDEDRMLSVDNGRLIASVIPGARLEVLEGVGHMFWWEQPGRSAALVREHALAPARSSRA
jgi:pimeloyl-ACP methyl ester carboxylesterase